jgi:hypothetical protein
MQSVQESKQELEASIRYAENAISSAKQTIESMEFRQEMAKKQHSEQTGREEALQREVAELKLQLEGHRTNMALLTDELEKPTMPVIPKDVAIAIFREGVAHGVSKACDELDNTPDIEISDRESMGNFDVEYTEYVNLSDHLDFDWLRSEVGVNDEADVIEALKNLCADNKFECRIHGVDDQGDDSKSA